MSFFVDSSVFYHTLAAFGHGAIVSLVTAGMRPLIFSDMPTYAVVQGL
jgi:hypothetical protein